MPVSLTIEPCMEEYYKTYNNKRDPTDSGFDLFTMETMEISPSMTGPVIISTAISFGVELLVNIGHYKVVPRSSISKTRLRLSERGKIYHPGNSYTLTVDVYVFGTEPFTIKKGERYFQLIRTDLAPFKVNLEIPHTLYVKCPNPEILEMYKAELASRETDIHELFPLLTCTTLEPHASTLVKTGAHVELVSSAGESKPLYLDLMDDGSLLALANYRGIIDAGYRGELMVPIDYGISPIVRNCPLVQQKLDNFDHAYISAGDSRPFRVVFVDELNTSRRGDGGFGSTGRS